MVYSEKEQELEGRCLPSRALLAEAARLKTLAHRYELELGKEGISPKDLSLMERARDQVEREHVRLELPPGKKKPLDREQLAVVVAALRWRSLLIHRATRVMFEDRPARLKYLRGIELHGLPERVYEELTLLLDAARMDINRLTRTDAVDEDFLHQGDDLRYQLLGLEPPDRDAMAKYEAARRSHRYGPPPQPPPEPEELPDVLDNAATLALVKGHLYGHLRRISAAGMAAFSVFSGRESRKWPQIRAEFALQVFPEEFDPSLLVFDPDVDIEKLRRTGSSHTAAAAAYQAPQMIVEEIEIEVEDDSDDEPEDEGPKLMLMPWETAPEPEQKTKKKKKKKKKKKQIVRRIEPAAAPAPPPPAEADVDIEPPAPAVDSAAEGKKTKRVVNPGGAPPPVGDMVNKPPPGAVGLVRPSSTRGRK